MAKPFKSMQDLDPGDVARLGDLVAALTGDDAEAFADTDPADFTDHVDVGQVFSDRALDGLIVYGEVVRHLDELGLRTNACAYLALSHPAFSGGAVWDNAGGAPAFRITELAVRDEEGFKRWLTKQSS